jgi:flagellin
MRINNNVMALNAHRQLAVNQSNAAKSMERLSSGLRINRAGDDAAGLAISEKMRGQIRGLKQAQRNAQDGISLIQTAEGALNETHAILQRMRELAVQSSTDTNTEADRAEIQKEINQLADEITRISTDTEFNTQNLLGGTFKEKVFHIGSNEAQNVRLSILDMSANALKVAGSGEGMAQFEIDGAKVENAATEAISIGEHEFDVVKLDNITMGDGSTIANYGLANDKGEIVAVSQDGEDFAILEEATKVSDLKTAEPVASATIAFGEPVIDGKVSMTVTAGTGDTVTLDDIKGTASLAISGLESGKYEVVAFDGAKHLTDVDWDDESVADEIANVMLNEAGDVVAVEFTDNAGEWYAVDDLDLTVDIASGDLDDDVIGDAKTLVETTALAAGTKFEVKADGGINVSTQEAADKAITIINDALETVSAERSKLGAMQNRLEHTIANLGTSAENLQAAEARIRDLDMAEEIMAFTKNNILQQAATAMLAQANMAPQSVLQLLG